MCPRRIYYCKRNIKSSSNERWFSTSSISEDHVKCSDQVKEGGPLDNSDVLENMWQKTARFLPKGLYIKGRANRVRDKHNPVNPRTR